MVEKAALRIADELRVLRAFPDTADVVEAAPIGRPLSGEQQHMVAALAAASGLAVVVGPAGAEKTAGLAATARTWSKQGRLWLVPPWPR